VRTAVTSRGSDVIAESTLKAGDEQWRSQAFVATTPGVPNKPMVPTAPTSPAANPLHPMRRHIGQSLDSLDGWRATAPQRCLQCRAMATL
jgi:hypothetical protein